MADFRHRLSTFLNDRGVNSPIAELTPDASTREYFRIGWKGSSAIACVYPAAFSAGQNTYVDVTGLFREADLPVAAIFEIDEQLGIIVLEDFGDGILRSLLQESDAETRETLIDEAIRLIARIQAATPLAFELDSIASRLRFDHEKLKWELDFFFEHYFSTFRGRRPSKEISVAIEREFNEIAQHLENRVSVLCHRDFHAANLMAAGDGSLRIIDHQDARLGSASYDLVSFLLDRVTRPPSPEWLEEKRKFFLNEREKHGLPRIPEQEFADEFRLQAIQRCLKAVGTFSFQAANRGKTHFVEYIDPVFRIVLHTLDSMHQFQALRSLIAGEIDQTRK